MLELTPGDWSEIYYAVELKRRLIKMGLYEDHDNRFVSFMRQANLDMIRNPPELDEEGQEWLDHMTEILDKIGPDGSNAYEASEKPNTQTEPIPGPELPRLIARRPKE